MTLPERLRRARRWLGTAVLVAAAAWAVTLGLLLRAIGGAVSRLAGGESLARAVAPVALAAGLVTLAALLWRWRAVRSTAALALWIEERQPALEYALVTAADPAVAAAGLSPALAQHAAAAEIETLTARAARRLVGRGLVAALAGTAAVLALRHAGLALDGGADPIGVRGPAAAAPSRLAPLTARVEPPPYARLPAVTLREPTSLDGLVGSTVTLAGRGSGAGITLALGADTLAAASADAGWSGRLRMPATPEVVTLRDRGYRRLVVLVPRPDSVPEVVLVAPAHDTTYQAVPAAPLAIEARATDDIGLAVGWFEYLISTGSGEHFTTVTRTGPRTALGGVRSARLRTTLALDTLALTPGSVVNIRTVVLDANDVTGPGRGVSETRTIRLAEARDSTAVAPAPPDQIDSMLISQRLLNLRTDTLLRTRARLTRAAVADRAMRYSNVQESIRLRVVAVVALLEDDGVGGTAPTEVSRLLRNAGDEMQSARIDLATAAPERARPHMRRALAILDQIRNAHRYYLRGRTPPELVDVSRVRLQARAETTPAPRGPRERLDDPDARLAERVERAARAYPSTRDAALDSLTFIRVAALGRRPDLADALARAIERLRAGAALAPSLAPVRALLSRAAEPLAGPPEWLGWSATR